MTWITNIAVWGGVGATLAINPWFQYDPINIPKMALVTVFAGFLTPWLVMQIRKINPFEFFILLVVLGFISTLIFSVLSSGAPLVQLVWGTWGRSTGLVTYIAFLIFLLTFLFLSNKPYRGKVRFIFERVGFVVSLYTIIQWAELDPVNWSQKALVATLGNINFMSSFLGLVCISYYLRVFHEKISFHTKVFYFAVMSVNLLLVYYSRSIQGIAIFLVGIVICTTFILRRQKSLGTSLAFFFPTAFLGLLVFLGTAFLGPLSALGQETVKYRIDYWKAGVRMTLDNAMTGIGMDSYGDFYRLYRDQDAILRTGPQRVTNTAHNIFLDVSSGAGLVALLFFCSLFLAVGLIVIKSLIDNTFDEDFVFWAAHFSGFFIFCLISINQIGVGIWGFIGMGLLLGCNESKLNTLGLERSSALSKKKKDVKESEYSLPLGSNKNASLGFSSRRGHKVFWGTDVTVACCVIFSVVQHVSVDTRLLYAVRSGDLNAAYEISYSPRAQDRHREIVFLKLDELNQKEKALAMARRATQLNERNWEGWVYILTSQLSSEKEKEYAAKVLLELDPQNLVLRQDLRPFTTDSKG